MCIRDRNGINKLSLNKNKRRGRIKGDSIVSFKRKRVNVKGRQTHEMDKHKSETAEKKD